MNEETQVIVENLFRAYLGNPASMPVAFERQAVEEGEAGKARVVADYIAGMTDRFAISEHQRLCEQT
jgi:dGTPase